MKLVKQAKIKQKIGEYETGKELGMYVHLAIFKKSCQCWNKLL